MFLRNVCFVALRRFVELTVITAFFSAIATLLNVLGVLSTAAAATVALVSVTVAIFYINVILMRNCYFDLKDSVLHYTANIIAYLLYAVLSVALFFLSSTGFTWLFAATKFLHFAPFSLPNEISVAIFHCIGIITVIVSPIGMDDMMMYMEEAARFYDEPAEEDVNK